MPDEITPDVTPVTPEVTEEVQPGPWAADLTEYFGDNADAIATADRYLREKVQPRMTELETDTAPARELWRDLEKDAGQTLADLVASVYGDEIAEKYVGLFAEDEPVAEETPAEETTLTKEQQEILDWANQQRDKELRSTRESAYEQAKSEFQEEHKDALSTDDLKLFDPFIAAANGDFDQALAAFQAHQQQLYARLGIEPGTKAEAPAPPPVLGGEATTAATPPVQTQYTKFGQLDDALDDILGEMRASRTPPPIVG